MPGAARRRPGKQSLPPKNPTPYTFAARAQRQEAGPQGGTLQMRHHFATNPTNLADNLADQSSGTGKGLGVGHAIDGVADTEEPQAALQLGNAGASVPTSKAGGGCGSEGGLQTEAMSASCMQEQGLTGGDSLLQCGFDQD